LRSHDICNRKDHDDGERGSPAKLAWDIRETGSWLASARHPALRVVHHTDAEREYAYDRDPTLGSGTDQILAAAGDQKWTVIDYGRRLGHRPLCSLRT
jgi:hypothetical protein